ncbi:helix-turn-helix transcriptional regulator [Streptomyces olivaceus]|uniref:helix-turn-helix domain-containing protein n=1 Tax=Streptomyces olivaceus TaxID=47716 RepID=UPI001CCE669A|nr:helix-turn-helix transcriptional regulator [Streptomyces olivaceus]MBZ6195541.1 helix-turn-helix transcriptional regulator [Streptomyces olivaceus]
MGGARRKDIDGSEGVPSFYGKELRWKREEAGFTLAQLTEGSFYGLSHLSEIERGERRMPRELAEHVDRVLETDGFFARRCEDVRNARRKGHAKYFERVLESERHADAIEEWCPTVFPGLLQCEPYIRAVVRATHPLEPQERTDEKVRARLGRALIFDEDDTKPEYWVILHEALIRHPIISPAEMAAQLDRVVALARRPRIIPQVLPLNCGAHPLMHGTAKVLSFTDAPPLVYTESPYSGDTIDEPGLVKQYRKAYDRLRAAALPPEASLAMIEEAAEDYRNVTPRS